MRTVEPGQLSDTRFRRPFRTPFTFRRRRNRHGGPPTSISTRAVDGSAEPDTVGRRTHSRPCDRRAGRLDPLTLSDSVRGPVAKSAESEVLGPSEEGTLVVHVPLSSLDSSYVHPHSRDSLQREARRWRGGSAAVGGVSRVWITAGHPVRKTIQPSRDREPISLQGVQRSLHAPRG